MVNTIYVIATLGTSGDLHPFLAVARALREQGEQVILLSQESHRAEVEAEGVAFEPIASTEDYYNAIDHPFMWHPLKGFGVFWRYLLVPAINPTFEILNRLSQQPATQVKVFASSLVVGARLARELLPIHLTTGHAAHIGLRSSADTMFIASWQIPRWMPMIFRRLFWKALDHYKLEPMAAPKINAWRKAHQLAELDEPIFQRWLHSPDQVIGMFPKDFGAIPNDWPVPVHLAGFPLYESTLVPVENDPELAEFLQENPALPLLVFFPGSASRGRNDLMYHSAHMLAQSGLFRCLWIGETRTDNSATLLQRAWLQLSQVLPKAKVFIHHGGIGSCAQGLAAHTAQIIIPAAYDQFDNGTRIKAMQLGTWLPKKQQNIETLNACIQQWSAKTLARQQSPTISRPNQANLSVLEICQRLRSA
jgi:rhamnosyltransferase subunit B